ncbi:ATP-binding protein [Gordonia sp. NPDC003424]
MTPNLRYHRARTELVESRIREVVAHRRSVDPTPDDPFRGLYVGEATVDSLLAPTADPAATPDARRGEIEEAADAAEADGGEIRLRRLARSASLSDLDVEILVIAMLPEVDGRWERLYGYLNDDVSRRRATPALALALAGMSTWAADARARMAPTGPLVELGLVRIEDTDRPFLSRTIRVPDRVVDHLLGGDTPPAELGDALSSPDAYPGETAHRVAAAFASGCGLVHIRQQDNGIGVAAAVAAIDSVGRRPLVVDARRIATDATAHILGVLRRESVLTDAVVVVEHIDALDLGVGGDRLFDGPQPVVTTGHALWQPEIADRLPVQLDAVRMSDRERIILWRDHLGDQGRALAADDVAAVTLAPRQIRRAVETARAAAAAEGAVLSAGHVRDGVRMLNSAGLERLARRVTPRVNWADLVLPSSTVEVLADLAARARHREQVLGEWRMRRGGGRGHGVIGLFAGESGTGKTMAAEVLAGDLGLEMYTVSLSSVVSKWVGETEKNLDRIFDEAELVNAVLVFDEADALFGKRSEVRDAHDRYANVETAYLLQRMEAFDGLAILTTNLRSNLDEAFTRRLDAVVEFPRPDEAARRDLWHRCLAPPVPCDRDIDVDHCARTFVLSGGNIRSASVTAAYRAAASGRMITTVDLIRGVEQEYRKLGRLIGTEFAPPSTLSDAQSA